MIDLAAETLITLDKVAERLLVSKTTVYGWITRGSGGIKLEAAKVGGRWRTSEEALQRFSNRLTPNQEEAADPTPPGRTTKQRQRYLESVEDQLDKAFGVKKCETCRIIIDAGKCVIPKNERLWCPNCLIKRKSASLGQRIRTFRWAASLSQQELSRRTNIDIDNLRAYESDRKKATEAHVAKLIEVLGKDVVSGLVG